METRILGRTGLKVTQLGYGAMEIRGAHRPNARPVTEGQAERILNAVLDAGITFIDTAPDYGGSEDHIGRFISHRRAEYTLATKCGCTDGQGHIWTRENLLRNIDESLHRMRTDHIDIWQLHNATVEDVDQGDLVAVMEEVRRAGKVRWVSISSRLPDITTFIERSIFDSYQIPYSALERTHEEIITLAAQSGAGTIIRGGVARGAPSEGGQGRDERWALWEKAGLDELLGPGESRTQFLLRFTISHPHMHTTIVGTMNPEHLAENVRTLQAGPLSADLYAEAMRRLNEVGETPAAG